MSNISIADYLKIKKVLIYLRDKKHEELTANNGYTHDGIEEISELLEGLQDVVNKLEKE